MQSFIFKYFYSFYKNDLRYDLLELRCRTAYLVYIGHDGRPQADSDQEQSADTNHLNSFFTR